MRLGAASVAAMLVLASALGLAADVQGRRDAARPQLDDAAAAATRRLQDHLALGPSPWHPLPIDPAASARAELVVAADGSGTHRTLQAAIDALPAAGTGVGRTVVRLRPGVYREVVCARGKAPFALVGDPADAGAVRIVEGRWNAQPKRAGVDPANPCDPALAAATYGTAGSASVAIFSDDVQLAHLTIANDAMDGVRDGVGYPEGAGESGGAQAVALMLQGDRIQLEGVRLLGHQDTFMARAPQPGAAARVYVHGSLIAGDVDFIFGDATLVIHRSTVHSRGGRRAPGNGGHVLAPSHAPSVPLGFLVAESRFVAEPRVRAASVSLGRAWDFRVPRGQWQAGTSPNGVALVRDSAVGGHIGPWSASTSRRPFSASGPMANRLFEHGNRTWAHAPEREVLAIDDGWAAAGMGTSGGADARDADVFDVGTRGQLVAALGGPARPRIVRVHGTIDLATDEQGRALGAGHWRDPVFGWDAFERAFDPATWGRRVPEGPQEDARRRSARRQAADVVLRVPSDTTLIGVGADARLRHGSLLLDGVDNVIVRNLSLHDAYDHFPAWDPRDNAAGEWNAELDNLSLRHATHVWVDHCSFDDGERPDAAEPLRLGRPQQRHDGLLDITQASDFVSVSFNVFRRHDKTLLIGGSDRHTGDEGRLRVTLHHNHFIEVAERTPRVRFGRVHVHGNLFELARDGPYAFGYSIGVGLASRVVAEHNTWVSDGKVPAHRLVRRLGGARLAERGSRLDGRAVDLLAALRAVGQALDEPPGWQPTFNHHLEPAAAAAGRVRAEAGTGRLPVAMDRRQ